MTRFARLSTNLSLTFILYYYYQTSFHIATKSKAGDLDKILNNKASDWALNMGATHFIEINN